MMTAPPNPFSAYPPPPTQTDYTWSTQVPPPPIISCAPGTQEPPPMAVPTKPISEPDEEKQKREGNYRHLFTLKCQMTIDHLSKNTAEDFWQ